MPSVHVKKNLFIALQLVCLTALVLVILQLQQQDREHLMARSLLATELASHIIINNDQEKIELKKTADGWQLTTPLQQPANQQRVQPLLSLLNLPSVHRYAESEVDLLELGLAPAQASVQINQLIFKFGNADATGKKRYLLSAGGVYLIDDLLYPLINASAQTFATPGAE